MASSRLKKLRARLEEEKLAALMVSQAENRRYLSGFVGTAGFLLVSPEKALLATDFRYARQAEAQAPDFQVVQIEGELPRWFRPLVEERLGAAVTMGFEAHDLPFATYQHLVASLDGSRLQVVPTEGLVEGLRLVKEEAELKSIQKAASLADTALEHAASLLKPGITEKELAWEIEKFLREEGSEGVPFEIIVASGPNAALPHAHPADRKLGKRETIVIDLGARIQGYCSDLTRTFWLGEGDETYAKVYDLVLGAQLTALATLGPGLSGEQADALARRVIEEGGYGEAFGHGLGHGVGLAVHEGPRLGKSSTERLAPGVVVTVEPGIYLPGWGGVRIEDTVVLEESGARPLTRAPKRDKWFL